MTKNLQNNNNHDRNKRSVESISFTKSTIFSGPLPPPEILKEFEQIVPGAAERIIKMSENQTAHRIELEKKVISSDIENSRRGQLFGFIVAIIGLVSSFLLVIKGHVVSGTLLGGTTLVSLVGVFVYGTKSRREERGQKKQQKENDNSKEQSRIIDAEVV